MPRPEDLCTESPQNHRLCRLCGESARNLHTTVDHYGTGLTTKHELRLLLHREAANLSRTALWLRGILTPKSRERRLVTFYGTPPLRSSWGGVLTLSYMSGDENCHSTPAPAAGRRRLALPGLAPLDTDPHPGGQPHPQEGGPCALPKNPCPNPCQVLENGLQ
jgi:hypothetical protein